MNKDYIIAWKSNTNARMGVGKNLMERQEAESLAAQLNEEHPEFQHIAVHKDTQNFAGLFPTPEPNPVFGIATVLTTIPVFSKREPESAPAADLQPETAGDPGPVTELQSDSEPEPVLALSEPGEWPEDKAA